MTGNENVEVIDERRVFGWTNKNGWDVSIRISIKKGKYGPFMGLSKISRPHEPMDERSEREFGPFFNLNNPAIMLEVSRNMKELAEKNFMVFKKHQEGMTKNEKKEV